MPPIRWTLLLLLVASLGSARGQSVDLTVGFGGSDRMGADLVVVGLREASTTSDLRLGVIASPSGTDALFGVRWSRATTLGLLGAVTMEVDGALRTDGHMRAVLAGSGVLGPASVGLVVGIRNADPEWFSIVGLAPRADDPRLPGTVWSVEADVRYRVDRQLLLGIEPGVFGSSAGVAARLEGSLRLRRWMGDLDALAAWHAWYDPVDRTVAGGIGAGAIWAPRRAPEWRAVAWLGVADGAAAPGLEVAGRATVGAGVDVDVALIAQPFRRDVPPYRASAELTVDVGATEVYARAQSHAGTERGSFSGALALGVRVPLPAR